MLPIKTFLEIYFCILSLIYSMSIELCLFCERPIFTKDKIIN